MAHFCFYAIFPNNIVIMFYALSLCGLHFLKPFKRYFIFLAHPLLNGLKRFESENQNVTKKTKHSQRT
jgi:hypothetical protein